MSIKPSGPLCSNCKRIDFNDLFYGSKYLERHDPYDTPIYQAGPAAGFLARRFTCPFCSIVCASLGSLDTSRDDPLRKLRIFLSAERAFRDVDSNSDAASNQPWPHALEVQASYTGLHVNPTVQTLFDETEGYSGDIFRSSYLNLCLRNDEHRSGSGAAFVVPDQLESLDFIQEWLSLCQHQHTICNKAFVQNPGIAQYPRLLVDCYQRRVIPTPLEATYVCLSYVCGTRFHDFVETINFDPGGYELPENLPLTISDAGVVAMKLDQRYLWVDALCISQNDPLAKREEIGNMNVIYSGAVLTICATSTDAYSGLTGISGPAREVPASVEFDEKKIIIHERKLNKRIKKLLGVRELGLEMLLSRRCLIFHKSEVVLECLSRVYRESFDEPDFSKSGFVERETVITISSSLRRSLILDPEGIEGATVSEEAIDSFGPKDRGYRRYSQFTDSLSAYSKRRLTYESDLLPAFEGALSRMTYDKMAFLYGMPCQWLPVCLLWHHYHPLDRIDWNVPSWSWAAWYHQGSVAEGQGRDSLRSIDLYTLPGGYNCVVSPQPYHISWQLSPDHRDIFAHAYCFDVRYSLRDRPESHPLSDIPELVVLAKDGATDRFGAQLLTREEIVRLKHGDPYHEIWQQPHCRPTLLKAAELDGQTRQCVVVLVSSSINHDKHTADQLVEKSADHPEAPIHRTFALRSNPLPDKIEDDIYVRCLLTTEVRPGVFERAGVVQFLGSRLAGLALDERHFVLS